MKLNPSKCAFGVSVARFLGFIVTRRGIEANPAQLKAILEFPYPAYRKKGTTADWQVGRPRAVHLSVYKPSKAVFYYPQVGKPVRME